MTFLCAFVSLWLLEAQAPPSPAAYAVSYVEVTPSARATTVADLKHYRDASRNDEGYVRFELFEQAGRPGHFAVIEAWADQKAFDAHAKAAHTKELQSKLQPLRVSDYDQRPYKILTVGPAPASSNGGLIYVLTHVDVAGPQTDAPGMLRRLAEASRKDEGNVRFDVLQHSARANHFTIIEVWQSQNALNAHAAASHTKQYRDELAPISGSPLDERLYRLWSPN